MTTPDIPSPALNSKEQAQRLLHVLRATIGDMALPSLDSGSAEDLESIISVLGPQAEMMMQHWQSSVDEFLAAITTQVQSSFVQHPERGEQITAVVKDIASQLTPAFTSLVGATRDAYTPLQQQLALLAGADERQKAFAVQLTLARVAVATREQLNALTEILDLLAEHLRQTFEEGDDLPTRNGAQQHSEHPIKLTGDYA